ncbi:hypothetical protein SUGI_1130280 [Cryptomeria japonica]|nr:hypothetical protein SUGI_1130280 [Cryptomeria japonica]
MAARITLLLVLHSRAPSRTLFKGSFRERQESTENQWERPICEGRGSHPAGLEKGCAVSSNACHGLSYFRLQ